MGFNKEKVQLDGLLQLIIKVDSYTERNIEVLHESYTEFRKIISVLHGRHTNIFGNLYNYDLKEIRNNRKKLSEDKSAEGRQKYMVIYRDSMGSAVERTIEYITEYIQ